MCASEFQIVKDAVANRRDVDEQTLAAMAILADRLERIKNLGGSFSLVGFSSALKKLQRRKTLATVG